MDRSDSAAQALAFERTCIESFIHHCATIMLVDNSQNLACVVQQLVKKFEACFTASSAPVTKSFLDNLQKLPILGHPPHPPRVLVTLIRATKLALSAGPLNEASVKAVQHLQSSSGRNIWEGKLDMLAIRALIIYTQHGSTSRFHEFMFRQTIAEGLHILKTHPLREPTKSAIFCRLQSLDQS